MWFALKKRYRRPCKGCSVYGIWALLLFGLWHIRTFTFFYLWHMRVLFQHIKMSNAFTLEKVINEKLQVIKCDYR